MTHSMVTHLSFHFWMLVGIVLAALGFAGLAIVAWTVPLTYVLLPYVLYRQGKKLWHRAGQ